MVKLGILVIITIFSFYVSNVNSQDDVEASFLQLPFEHDWRVLMSSCFKDFIQENNPDSEKCSPSYAWSITEALRLRICIKSYGKDKSIKLSPLQLISCSDKGGCDEKKGDELIEVLKYVEQNGLVNGECFREDCKFDAECVNKHQRVHLENIRVLSNAGPIMQEIIYSGPVIATFDMYEDFFQYRSGIYRHTGGKLIGPHSLVIVGYVRDSQGEEYWIAKNNFGSSWGERGFANFPFGSLNIDSNVLTFEQSLK